MPTFYSASGNPEVWDKQPEGYITVEEWESARAAEEAVAEAIRLAEYNKPENVRARKLAAIDAETSAAILAGFGYAVDGEILHFSYDRDDQQNFADSANAALLTQTGGQGLPENVTWNAYRKHEDGARELVRLTLGPTEFLALYIGGALAHKAAVMQEGGNRKDAVEVAIKNGAPVEEVEGI